MQLLHFHLPKTGGTALREYFCEQLGSDRVSAALVGLKLSDALLRWSQTDVISGHFTVHQGDSLPRERFCLTVLRHPLDRFLSEFFFYKNNNEARLLNNRFRDLTLDGYIDAAGQPDAASVQIQLDMLYPLGTKAGLHLCQEDRLQAAIRALDSFDLIGLQEEMEDFCCMLSVQMQWPQRALPRANLTRHRLAVDDLTTTQKRAIERILAAEIELYNNAARRFQRDRRNRLMAAVAVSIPEDRAATPDQQRAVKARLNFGDRQCEVLDVSVIGQLSGTGTVMVSERVTVDISFVVSHPVQTICIGMSIRDESGALMHGTNSHLLGNDYALTVGTYHAHFSFLNRLGLGHYTIDVALTPTTSHHEGCYHWLEQAARLEVYDNIAFGFEGRVLLDDDLGLFIECGDQPVQPVMPTLLDLPLRAFGRINDPLQDFSAAIQSLSDIKTVSCGIDAFVPLRVRNSGAQTWPSLGRRPVCLSYRWYTGNGDLIVADGLRTDLPCDLRAGEAVVVSLHVRVPKECGSYILVTSLLQEEVEWFVDCDVDSAHFLPIEVT